MEVFPDTELARIGQLDQVVSSMRVRGVTFNRYVDKVQLGFEEESHGYTRKLTSGSRGIFVTPHVWDLATNYAIPVEHVLEVIIDRLLLLLVIKDRAERGISKVYTMHETQAIACEVQTRPEYIDAKRTRFTEDSLLWMTFATHTEKNRHLHAALGTDGVRIPATLQSFQDRRGFALTQESQMPEYFRALGI